MYIIGGFFVAVYDMGWDGMVPGATPTRVWIGVRSVSKATYPGLWDQMVAGGQPTGIG